MGRGPRQQGAATMTTVVVSRSRGIVGRTMLSGLCYGLSDSSQAVGGNWRQTVRSVLLMMMLLLVSVVVVMIKVMMNNLSIEEDKNDQAICE